MANASICIEIGTERVRANMTGDRPYSRHLSIRSGDDFIGSIWSKDTAYLERLAAAINAAAEEPGLAEAAE